MKMYICKLCTANQMLFQSKFCVIIVRKPITAFAKIHPPAGLCPLYGCGFHPQTPSAPHYFFAPPPLQSDKCLWSRNCGHMIHEQYFMLTFPKTCISRVFVSQLRLPAVKSPQTENTRSTYACDAGAEMMSAASGDSTVAGVSLFPCLFQLLQCF